jgi:hypothetical protein
VRATLSMPQCSAPPPASRWQPNLARESSKACPGGALHTVNAWLRELLSGLADWLS